MKPILPQEVEFILSRLESNGYRADIVGGCVRDYILGAIPSDYDITTSAKPNEIKAVFSDMRTLDIGIKHGTVTLIIKGVPYEITTYRIESEYLDHRHPSRVEFTNKLSDDLGRRDFTMNAIAYNPKDGFTDLFFGRDDISSNIVRAVGDARERFFEDALRILRAIRFSSVLNFRIEEKTAVAAVEMSHLISSVSGERIAVEWKKTLCGVGAYAAITENSRVLTSFLPLDAIRLPDRIGFDSASPEIRELAIFYLSADDPECAFSLSAERMKYESARRKFGISVFSLIKTDPDLSDERKIVRLMSQYGAECVEGTIMLLVALGKEDKTLISIYKRILSKKIPYRISDIKISGRTLSALGYSGASIGEELLRLLYCVIDGEIENTAEALLSSAEKHINASPFEKGKQRN